MPQKIGNYIYFAIVAIGVRKFSSKRNLESMHPGYVRSGVWGGAPAAGGRDPQVKNFEDNLTTDREAKILLL